MNENGVNLEVFGIPMLDATYLMTDEQGGGRTLTLTFIIQNREECIPLQQSGMSCLQ